MFKRKCTLCGGDLVRGKCIECGLDNNRKRMRQVDDFNQSNGSERYKNDAFFEDLKQEQREMEVEDVYVRQEQIDYSKPKRKSILDIPNLDRRIPPPPRRNTSNTSNNNKKNESTRAVKLIRTIIIIVIVFNVLGGVFSLLASLAFNAIEEVTNVMDFGGTEEVVQYISEVDFSAMQEGERELAETGASYENVLSAGYYRVGTDIPEGIYSIECIYNGSIAINNQEDGTFVSEYLGSENIGECYEGIYLYNGTYIIIDNDATLNFVSENANYENMEYMVNPNTQEYQLTAGINVAGEDFEAGVYDFSMIEGCYGIIYIYASEEDAMNEDCYKYESVFMSKMDFSDEDETKYQLSKLSNVTLPEGYVVVIEEDESLDYLVLTPSPIIYNEDYDSVYDSFYSSFYTY